MSGELANASGRYPFGAGLAGYRPEPFGLGLSALIPNAISFSTPTVPVNPPAQHGTPPRWRERTVT